MTKRSLAIATLLFGFDAAVDMSAPAPVYKAPHALVQSYYNWNGFYAARSSTTRSTSAALA